MVVQMNGDLKQKADDLIDKAYQKGYEDGFKDGEKHKENVLLDTNQGSSNKECIDCMYWGMNECQNPTICKNSQYWRAKVDVFSEHLVEDLEYLIKEILKKEEEMKKS